MKTGEYILIVEDDPNLAEVITSALGMEFTCVCTRSMREACTKFGTQPFDLVIADVNLPDGSGLSMLEKFRETGTSIPFIAMSGMPSVEASLLALRLKVSAFLTKPFEFQELRQLATSLLSQQRETRALLKDPNLRDTVVYTRSRLQLLAHLEEQQGHLQNWSDQLARTVAGAQSANRTGLGNVVGDYLRSSLPELAASLRRMQQIAQSAVTLPETADPARLRQWSSQLDQARRAVEPDGAEPVRR
ncbi:MAG: response regulator [Verrucomicrobia bacterium]|nr:response regulator [Verrucomicrobiota bacterium]